MLPWRIGAPPSLSSTQRLQGQVRTVILVPRGGHAAYMSYSQPSHFHASHWTMLQTVPRQDVISPCSSCGATFAGLPLVESMLWKPPSSWRPSFLPVPPTIRPFNRNVSRYCWELKTINYILPSLRYFDHVLEGLKFHS